MKPQKSLLRAPGLVPYPGSGVLREWQRAEDGFRVSGSSTSSPSSGLGFRV